MVGAFLDVTHEPEQLPRPVDRRATAQREPCAAIRLTVILRVRRHEPARREYGRECMHDWHQEFVLRAGAMRLRTTMICACASTAATPVYPWITPLLMATFALSPSVRLLFRTAPFGPRRSSGCPASHVSNSAASCCSHTARCAAFVSRSGSTGNASLARCRCAITCAAASNFLACRSNSARVPLRCLLALLEQVLQRVLERPRQQLLGQIDGK